MTRLLAELYTPLPIVSDLHRTSLHEALRSLGYAKPTVYVHADAINNALEVVLSMHLPVLVQVDSEITDLHEWYVVWDGKAVGSPGD